MWFAITVTGLLVFTIVFLSAHHAAVKYQLKKRHMESLFRVDDHAQVNLPQRPAEIVSAVISKELERV